MNKQFRHWIELSITCVEYFIAIVLLLCVVGFTIGIISSIGKLNWQNAELFYEITSHILMLVIGVELVRTLLLHNPEAILELLAFVVARKALKLDTTVTEVLLSVLAFIALLAARKYLFCNQSKQSHSPTREERQEHPE
jgi:hypothetical protein